jgi:archaemetzincin
MKMRKSKLVIVPLGEVDYFLVNKLATNLSSTLSLTSNILQGSKLPTESYNIMRSQYFSTVILQHLELKKSSQREILLGVMEEDIYGNDGHFVLSNHDNLTGCGLISLLHFRSDFYGLPENEKWIYPRLFKESFKIVMQLMGMRTCRNPNCILYYSDEMRDIDDKRLKLCDICQREFFKLA